MHSSTRRRSYERNGLSHQLGVMGRCVQMAVNQDRGFRIALLERSARSNGKFALCNHNPPFGMPGPSAYVITEEDLVRMSAGATGYAEILDGSSSFGTEADSPPSIRRKRQARLAGT